MSCPFSRFLPVAVRYQGKKPTSGCQTWPPQIREKTFSNTRKDLFLSLKAALVDLMPGIR